VDRSPINHQPPSVGEAVRSVATVAGVVVLVLGMLVGFVYAAVFVDLVPQLQ
jgi:uncharacterized membrane protein